MIFTGSHAPLPNSLASGGEGLHTLTGKVVCFRSASEVTQQPLYGCVLGVSITELLVEEFVIADRGGLLEEKRVQLKEVENLMWSTQVQLRALREDMSRIKSKHQLYRQRCHRLLNDAVCMVQQIDSQDWGKVSIFGCGVLDAMHICSTAAALVSGQEDSTSWEEAVALISDSSFVSRLKEASRTTFPPRFDPARISRWRTKIKEGVVGDGRGHGSCMQGLVALRKWVSAYLQREQCELDLCNEEKSVSAEMDACIGKLHRLQECRQHSLQQLQFVSAGHFLQRTGNTQRVSVGCIRFVLGVPSKYGAVFVVSDGDSPCQHGGGPQDHVEEEIKRDMKRLHQTGTTYSMGLDASPPLCKGRQAKPLSTSDEGNRGSPTGRGSPANDVELTGENFCGDPLLRLDSAATATLQRRTQQRISLRIEGGERDRSSPCSSLLLKLGSLQQENSRLAAHFTRKCRRHTNCATSDVGHAHDEPCTNDDRFSPAQTPCLANLASWGLSPSPGQLHIEEREAREEQVPQFGELQAIVKDLRQVSCVTLANGRECDEMLETCRFLVSALKWAKKQIDDQNEQLTEFSLAQVQMKKENAMLRVLLQMYRSHALNHRIGDEASSNSPGHTTLASTPPKEDSKLARVRPVELSELLDRLEESADFLMAVYSVSDRNSASIQ